MRMLLLAVLLTIALGVVCAEWTEKLRVQAVDNYMNPISGCTVEVDYQKQVTGGVEAKAIGTTDGNGVFEVTLHDFVSTYGGGEIRTYTVIMSPSFGLPGETRKVKYGDNPIGGAHLEQFQFNTTSARVTVAVNNQKGGPVPNATVSLDVLSGMTDEKGVAKFGVPLGSYTVNVAKDGFTASQSFILAADATVDVELLVYENTLKVIATNEYGAPLSDVNLTFNNIELQTNASGEAAFSGLRVSKGTLKGTYNGIERTADIEFVEEAQTKTLVFPSTPLTIDKISVQALDPYEQNCTILVSCRAKDERVALSKISMTLVFSKNGGEWNSLTQKNELGIFEFAVPCSAPLDFSYTLTASNDYGSSQTPIYNMSIPAPVVCQENETQDCTTSENCPGTQPCVSGSWGDCADNPDDECPLVAGPGPEGNKSTGGQFNWLSMPSGVGPAMAALILVGILALFGGVAILMLTQREKVSGLFDGIKNWFAAVRHVDKVIERADKEYAREKVSQKFMKDGSTDEFFGLDKEDKMKPGSPLAQQPPSPPPEEKPEENPQEKPSEEGGS